MLEVLRRHTGVTTPASDLPLSCFTFRQVKLSWLDFTGIVSAENWSNTSENQLQHTLKYMFYSLVFRPLRFLTSKWLFWVPYNFSSKFSSDFLIFFFKLHPSGVGSETVKEKHVSCCFLTLSSLFQFASLGRYQVLQYFN